MRSEVPTVSRSTIHEYAGYFLKLGFMTEIFLKIRLSFSKLVIVILKIRQHYFSVMTQNNSNSFIKYLMFDLFGHPDMER